MLRLKKYPKRSPNWIITGTVAGVHLFESTGTRDRGQAEAYRIKREREVYEAAKLGRVQPATFADAVILYLNKGKQSRFMAPLLDHFKETPLPEIGQVAVNEAARYNRRPKSRDKYPRKRQRISNTWGTYPVHWARFVPVFARAWQINFAILVQ